MKERTQEVNAVMSKDLIQILSQTGQYEDLVNGKIIFQIWRKYCVLLKNVWAEIIVESKGTYLIGDDIGVMKSSSTSFVDEKDV